MKFPTDHHTLAFGELSALDWHEVVRRANAYDELRTALHNVWEYRHGLLSRANAAGCRETSTGEWVRDPWSEAFIDAGIVLAKYKEDK